MALSLLIMKSCPPWKPLLLTPLLFGNIALTASAAPGGPLKPRSGAAQQPRAPDLVKSLLLPAPTVVEEELEATWSWKGELQLGSSGMLRLLAGWVSDVEFSALELVPGKNFTELVYRKVVGGKVVIARRQKVAPIVKGTLTLINRNGSGTGLGLLWNGAQVATFPGVGEGQLGYVGHNGVLRDHRFQPIEPIVFRDDFMRTQGPDEPEIPGEWQVAAGLWKTSGTLRPRADDSLNPNPFVFRATAPGKIAVEARALAGKWFWTDYAVTVAVKPELEETGQPLVVGLEAYRQADGASVRAEVDFGSGVVSLKQSGKVLAQSQPLETEFDQWHRLRLEPGPGRARVLLDGVEVVTAQTTLAQGQAGLYARLGGGNFADFDDVRISSASVAEGWGEPPLPDKFVKDRLMQFWASNARAWKRDTTGTNWHTGDFYGGNLTLQMPLGQLEPTTGVQAVLFGSPQNSALGTRVRFTRETEKKELKYEVFLTGQTQPSATGKIAVEEETPKLALMVKEAEGKKQLLAQINSSKPRVMAVVEPKHLTGTKIGLIPLANGKPLPPASLKSLNLTATTILRDGRAVMGINISPVTEQLGKDLGLPDAKGAIVDSVEEGSPAQKAGVRVGDVIRVVDGKPITDLTSLRDAIGAREAGAPVKFQVLRGEGDQSKLDWEEVEATTGNVLDYSFTMAPTDWRTTKGKWEISERWTCSPQWSFFAGEHDANPTLWSRFSTQGDFTVEAYLATPMDLARGERSPMDLNLTVGGDGKDLASGYSFLFGAKQRTVNQIRRGDDVVWEKPCVLPPGVGDTHQDWFYVRLERRQTKEGIRFLYSVNGREVANYLDNKPLADKGQIAFWTVNGGLSIARVRLWNGGIKTSPPAPARALLAAKPIPNALGEWAVRTERHQPTAVVRTVSAASTAAGAGASGGAREPKTSALEITNAQSGGDWTVFVTRKAYDAIKQPVLNFEYKVPAGVKVNLYAKVEGSWREIGFTAPKVQGDSRDQAKLGKIEKVIQDDQWHNASFDVLSALRAKGIRSTTVEALSFAAPASDYLRAGFGGNHLGATYYLRNFQAPELTSSTGAVGG